MMKAIQAGNITIGGDAPLAIGRSGQRDQRLKTPHKIGHFDGVADGVDGRIAGLHVVVDLDAAAAAELGPDADLEALAEILGQLVAEGKIRAFGLSNESAWGTMTWNRLLEEAGAPRVATIQNEYSLMCRHYDTDMAEVGYQEDVTLLAFSPLAAGLLTGKYTGGAVPEGSRLSINETLGGRARAQSFAAAEAYVKVSADHGLDPVHMALAWCVERPFPNIPIFGATTTVERADFSTARRMTSTWVSSRYVAWIVVPPEFERRPERPRATSSRFSTRVS